jgi:tetratricopeptide (TPR) repeat protein
VSLVREATVGRDPVERATAQFHLGAALTEDGRLDEAGSVLQQAVNGFDAWSHPLEHAKASNALGVALRLAGRQREAVEAFGRAGAGFERANATLERGAAVFNAGLAQREAGDLAAALDSFAAASELLEDAPRHAAAAARELGATQLADGQLERAERTLERAMELAEAAGDPAGLAGAANALGLVHLATGRAQDAIAALESAIAGNPRAVRPEGHAMAKANLALAYEQAGHSPRARLAARQAISLPGAPAPVCDQAESLLERLGDPQGDILLVLDEEPLERWLSIARDELARWLDGGSAIRDEEAAAWVEGQLARPQRAHELAEAWLAALLELPPQAMEPLIGSLVEALGRRNGDEQERFRSQFAMAMARFHVPQLLRLRAAFSHISAELGQDDSWN